MMALGSGRRILGLASLFASTVLVGGTMVVAGQDGASSDLISLNPMKTVELISLKGFVERPLFDPSRRLAPKTPQPEVVQAHPVPVGPPPALILLGVIHGERDMAIVQRDSQKTTSLLYTGDRVGDWTLTVLPPLGVRLQSGTRTFEYALFVKGAVARHIDVGAPALSANFGQSVVPGPAGGPGPGPDLPAVMPDWHLDFSIN